MFFDLSDTRNAWDDEITDEHPAPPFVVPGVTIEDGLYCCAPCGIAVLSEHLHARGFRGDIAAELGALIRAGRVEARQEAFGGAYVTLYHVVTGAR